MKREITAYLKKYDQPQSLAAVCDNCAPDTDPTAVRDALDEMVSAGSVARIEDGVHANGMPAVWYAPSARD